MVQNTSIFQAGFMLDVKSKRLGTFEATVRVTTKHCWHSYVCRRGVRPTSLCRQNPLCGHSDADRRGLLSVVVCGGLAKQAEKKNLLLLTHGIFTRGLFRWSWASTAIVADATVRRAV